MFQFGCNVVLVSHYGVVLSVKIDTKPIQQCPTI